MDGKRPLAQRFSTCFLQAGVPRNIGPTCQPVKEKTELTVQRDSMKETGTPLSVSHFAARDSGMTASSQNFAHEKQIGQQSAQMYRGVQIINQLRTDRGLCENHFEHGE